MLQWRFSLETVSVMKVHSPHLMSCCKSIQEKEHGREGELRRCDGSSSVKSGTAIHIVIFVFKDTQL